MDGKGAGGYRLEPMKSVETIDKWFNVIMMTALVFFAHIGFYFLAGKACHLLGVNNPKAYEAMATAFLFIGVINAKRTWDSQKQKADL